MTKYLYKTKYLSILNVFITIAATNKLVSKRSIEDANSYLLNEHNENNTPRCAAGMITTFNCIF